MPEPLAASYPSTDFRRCIRCYDGALDAGFCARLVQAFGGAAEAQVRRERGWRAGLEDSAWTELDLTAHGDAALCAYFEQRTDEYLRRYNRDVGLSLEVPARVALSELRMKRYRPGTGEGFQLHFDSINAVANRYLVFLWYLNDVTEGGATVFPDLDVAVAPRAGRLLMFPPYWMYQHAGQPPVSGDKFILSAYLLFPNLR